MSLLFKALENILSWHVLIFFVVRSENHKSLKFETFAWESQPSKD